MGLNDDLLYSDRHPFFRKRVEAAWNAATDAGAEITFDQMWAAIKGADQACIDEIARILRPEDWDAIEEYSKQRKGKEAK